MFKALRDKLAANRERNELNRRSVALSEDETLIAAHAPEVASMGFVNGGAFVLSAIREWKATANEAELHEFARRLQASQESWTAEGLTMPWWGNLKVLRDYQAELSS